MTTAKKQVLPLIQEIGQIGRAANVHMIAATQTPVREVIPTAIKCNFDTRIGLRTACAQDSRNITGLTGCERFPNPKVEHKAYGYVIDGADRSIYNIPKYPDYQTESVIAHWLKQA